MTYTTVKNEIVYSYFIVACRGVVVRERVGTTLIQLIGLYGYFCSNGVCIKMCRTNGNDSRLFERSHKYFELLT